MLPTKWRIVVENLLGVTIDSGILSLKYQGWYIGSDNKLIYGAESGDFANQTLPIANNSFHASNVVDNGLETNPFQGADLQVKFSLSGNVATPSGLIIVYFQRSLATADWPDNGQGKTIETIRRTAKLDYSETLPVGV